MTIESKPQPQPEVRRFPVTADAAEVVKALSDDGVVIIEKFLSADQVIRFNAEIDPVMKNNWSLSERRASSKPSPWLVDILGPWTRRVHNAVEVSKVFRHEVLNHNLMHDISRLALEAHGDYWLSSSGIIENCPGAKRQSWHRDQAPNTLFQQGPDKPSILLNFFTALTDFDDETGYTEYIWHSHKEVAVIDPDEEHPIVVTKLKAGDAALLSGNIVHRGPDNVSEERYRRSMALCVVPAMVTPFEATFHLNRSMVETMTPKAQKMIGWRSFESSKPFGLGMWTVHANEASAEIGLKSNQPDKE
jgi:verruculogen synthase